MMEQTTSLSSYLRDIFEESYQDAVNLTSLRMQVLSNTFPLYPIATLEQILDDNWLPINED